MRHRDKSGVRQQIRRISRVIGPERAYMLWTSRWGLRFPALCPARDLNLFISRKIDGVSVLAQYGIMFDSQTGIAGLGPNTAIAAYNCDLHPGQRQWHGFLDKEIDVLAGRAARKVGIGAEMATSSLGVPLPLLFYGWEAPVPLRVTSELRAAAVTRFNVAEGAEPTSEQLLFLWQELPEVVKLPSGELYFLYPATHVVPSLGQAYPIHPETGEAPPVTVATDGTVSDNGMWVQRGNWIPTIPPGFRVFAVGDSLVGETKVNPAHRVLEDEKLMPCDRRMLAEDPRQQEEVKRRVEALPARKRLELAEALRAKLQDVDVPTINDLLSALLEPHKAFNASEEPRLVCIPVAMLVGAAAPGWDIDLLTQGESASRLLRRTHGAAARTVG